MSRKTKILYVSHFPHYKMGGQKSMIALAEALNKSRYEAEFLINSAGPLSEYLESKGFVCHIRELFPFKPKFYPKILKNAFWLANLVRSQSIDILHPDYERDGLFCGLTKALCKAKMVWHVRLTRPTKQDHFLVKLADGIIAISEGAKTRFDLFSRAIQSKISVVYNGVDVQKFRPIDKAEQRLANGLDPDKRTGIFVGQLVSHKGIFEILEALKQLGNEYQFLFCGEFVDGEVEHEFNKQLESINGSGGGCAVFLLGQREDVHILMGISDFLLLPSHEGNEGMGRVIFEAMATGCIPIGSDISGVRDAITPATGLLIPEKSPELIVAAIERLFSSGELESMVSHARTRAVEIFSIDRHAREVEKVYDSLLR